MRHGASSRGLLGLNTSRGHGSLSPVPTIADEVARAADAIRPGDLVIPPTETVYGLAADAGNSSPAVAKLYEAKGRPRFNPLIAHVADLRPPRPAEPSTRAGLGAGRSLRPGPLTWWSPRTANR